MAIEEPPQNHARLGQQDVKQGLGRFRKRLDLDLLDRSARIAQNGAGGVHAGANAGRGRVVVPERCDEPETEAAEAGRRRIDGRSREPAQKSRGIRAAARDRPGVIERPGEHRDARERHQAVGRLQPHRTAIGGRDADRTPGIGPHGRVTEAGGDGRSRAAAGAARGAAGIPRVVGLPHPGIDRAVGELQQIGLGDQHRARLTQVRDHGGIARRGRGEDGVGAEAGDRACDVHQILDADGDAVQRTAVAAARELLLGPRGVGAGGFSESAHDGVELAVVAVDPLEAGFHDRRWRQRAAPVVPTERGDGAEGDVGVSHRAQPAPTVGRRLRSQPSAAPAVAGPPRQARRIWGRAPQLSPHRARNPPHARGSARHRRLPVGRWSRGAWGEQSSGCHHDTQYGCPQPDSTTDLNAPRAPVPPSPPLGAERAGERWGCFFLSLRRRALAPFAWLRALFVPIPSHQIKHLRINVNSQDQRSLRIVLHCTVITESARM